MEEKIVYCKIGEQGRLKRLKYLKEADKSDLGCIRKAFTDVVDQDESLKLLFFNHFLVFQQFDEEMGANVDLEPSDMIVNKSTIVVCSIPKVQTHVSRPVGVDKKPEESAKILATFDLPVLNDPAVFPGIQDDLQSQGKEITRAPKRPSDVLDSSHQHANRNGSLNMQPQKRVKLAVPSTQRVKYPANLPPLPSELSGCKERNEVYQNQAVFVRFWADHLRIVTDGHPSPQDQINYAQTIVDTFPELKGGKNGYSVLKHQISRRLSNKKYHQSTRTRQANVQSSSSRVTLAQVKCAVEKVLASPSVSTIQQKYSGLEPSNDIQTALMALEECSTTDTSDNVKNLMRETSSVRRQWVKTEAQEIRQVTMKYIQLTVPSLIVFELCNIRNLDECKLMDKIDRLLENLGIFFSVEITGESSKVSIISKLYDRLTTARSRGVNEPLLTIKEAGKSLADLSSAEGCSPRLVVYTSDDDLSAAFIVADEIVKIKIPEPTVSFSLACLIACYYAWDTTYPSAYTNVLQFLSHEILGESIKNNKTIERFQRDLNFSLKSNQKENINQN